MYFSLTQPFSSVWLKLICDAFTCLYLRIYSRRFHEAQAAPPPITNGRVAVLLVGETGLPRCTMAGRSEQIAAIGWQKDLVFAMLRAKGFGVDVFLATNDCGSGELARCKPSTTSNFILRLKEEDRDGSVTAQ